MFVDISGRVKLISGGRVALALGVMDILPLETTSKERYWTVVPLIQFRTNVTDEALLSPSVQLNIELNTVPPDST
jgi:hypothetical protein